MMSTTFDTQALPPLRLVEDQPEPRRLVNCFSGRRLFRSVPKPDRLVLIGLTTGLEPFYFDVKALNGLADRCSRSGNAVSFCERVLALDAFRGFRRQNGLRYLGSNAIQRRMGDHHYVLAIFDQLPGTCSVARFPLFDANGRLPCRIQDTEFGKDLSEIVAVLREERIIA